MYVHILFSQVSRESNTNVVANNSKNWLNTQRLQTFEE